MVLLRVLPESVNPMLSEIQLCRDLRQALYYCNRPILEPDAGYAIACLHSVSLERQRAQNPAVHMIQ